MARALEEDSPSTAAPGLLYDPPLERTVPADTMIVGREPRVRRPGPDRPYVIVRQAMSLEHRILAVGHQVAQIQRRLPTLGYVFQEPAAAFPGPEQGTDDAIARIEREVGTLPLAIKLFWRRVGSVNFIGKHDEWGGCEYPDPLVVFPPSQAIIELDEFLEDREERMRSNFPYFVPIAPDDYHKEDVSGGMWYNLSAPAVADDPQLNDERHRMTFVSYLELAVHWGGFPGLDRCPDHGWPLHQMVGGPVCEE